MLACVASQALAYYELVFEQPAGYEASWAYGRDTAGYYYGVAANRNWGAVCDPNAIVVRWDRSGHIASMTPNDGDGVANIEALPGGVVAFSKDADPGKYFCWNQDGSITPYPLDFFIFACDKETGALAGLDDLGKAVTIVSGKTTALDYGSYDTIYPSAINASGWTIGTGWANGSESHGFIWDPTGKMVMDNVNVWFDNINDAGDIVGASKGSFNSSFVLRENLTFWHTLGCGIYNSCACINSAGYVVETGADYDWGNRNYLNGTGFNLRLFGFEDFSPYSLEDDFTIVGAQWYWDGHTYQRAAAYVPEPSSLVTLTGLVGFGFGVPLLRRHKHN
jgi:hypothetical protein